MNEYEFETNLCCDFVTPELDKIKFPMIAEYTVDYDGAIYIDNIKAKAIYIDNMQIAIAAYLSRLEDFDHLINEIEEVEKTKREAEELSRLSGGEL